MKAGHQNQAAIQQKAQFLEKDNEQLKHYVKDLEKSLKINKEIIDSLLQGTDRTMQTVILKMRQDNENQYMTVKKQFEEIKSANSYILILEQLNQEYKKKEMENNNIFLDQILNLKQQIEKKSFIVDSKEKSFNDLMQFVRSYMPANDKQAWNKVEKICNEKKQQDRQLQTMNAQNLVSLLQEKD